MAETTRGASVDIVEGEEMSLLNPSRTSKTRSELIAADKAMRKAKMLNGMPRSTSLSTSLGQQIPSANDQIHQNLYVEQETFKEMERQDGPKITLVKPSFKTVRHKKYKKFPQ